MSQIVRSFNELFFTPSPSLKAGMAVAAILTLLLVGVIVYLLVYKNAIVPASTPPISSPASVKALQESRMEAIKEDTQLIADNSFYTGLINSLAPNERYLVNLAPMTASLGGYIGPIGPPGKPSPGIFYSDFYLQTALRAGIRSFVLPVSTYVDDNKVPPLWPFSGHPAIVCRDGDGKIISLNGMSIKQFCTDLMRFNHENTAQSNEPILLYIKEDTAHVPAKDKKEEKYAKFMSRIAEGLSVIPATNRLTTLGGFGSAVGAANEATILTQIPLTELKSKVLIFTDFDTKIGLKHAYQGMRPTLDDFTNFIVKPVVAQNAGMTVGTPGARSVKMVDISGSKVNWTDQSRTTLHMTSQDHPLNALRNVSVVNAAISTGIQIVPLPYFMTESAEDMQPIWKTWNGYAWRLKDEGARYVKPDPVVPSKPSTALNARVSPELQPGQLVVGSQGR